MFTKESNYRSVPRNISESQVLMMTQDSLHDLLCDLGQTPFQAFFFVTLETIKQLSHMLHVMVYLPTFGWLLGQMLINIPYMDHMGKTTILTGAKRRELSGMIHWLTINNNPSNPQQAIHSLRLAPVSITRVCLKVPESRWSKNVWRNCGDFLVPFSGHISPDEGLQLCIFASRVAPAYCGKW